MICYNCRNEIGDTFCHCCGAPLEREKEQDQEQEIGQPKRKGLAGLVVVVALVAVVGAGAVWYLNGGRQGAGAKEGNPAGETNSREEGKSREEDMDSASAQEQQPEAGESEGAEDAGPVGAPAPSASDYAAICEEIRQTDYIMTEKQDIMRGMLNALTDSKMLAYQ